MASATTSGASTRRTTRQATLKRTITATTDSESSAGVSPSDSPRASASSTSLSSMSSVDDAADKQVKSESREGNSEYDNLIDTYGNQFTPPDYTIKDIRDAIPAHCFERSALLGWGYILRDMACLATTFYLCHNYVTPEYIPSLPVRAVLWGLYTVLQGLFGTGLWVIAHECGHGAFSDSNRINDFTGWLLHSALFVPYFSWKYSHSAHHKATGHMEREMVFLPRTREQYASRVGKLVHELGELTEETPVFTLTMLLLQQLVGWPNYLLTNITGHNFHERQREGRGKGKKNGLGGGVNHFYPSSPLFTEAQAQAIVLSDVGIALNAAVQIYLGKTFGWSNTLVWFWIPWLWVNHWLVAITFLQHTDPSLPHYQPGEWNFVRGAAATIDREMGFVGRHLLHGIVETHVLHHYISSIPFYHADEASEAIKPVMGKHYRADTEGGPLGFLRALYRCARMCQWVEPSADAKGAGKGVLFYRNRNGLGTKPAPMEAPR
ncbi:omega-6 fatty acid desaturase / acyl-lipid omega-6 desaturase (Delta-12 desaturase) [Geosmithia morbida]|uniref:Omega-6 fatty acid desaturase / acyl-lipid omega-6 desaturase (Delta-12 desaturase) n=1 Tax=Geosmithia morbida TaxID=1094350 RepID=A0A9P4Z3F9_9HYPO|nr:omega-6 fatty acid desaturase / acyl-lipid omega-6 desaturase (Delta-12 desaturase) [Geosmithia morbida]KAF4127000.1 omega-6 fatty acid desaturase / acyl-lipid omega-6 desaturase (Delta-12 desaturase) [Geosmithia morbida]